METTDAIRVRKRKLSDTSLIISWCTESLGCLETVARGARRPKSVFAGKLDLFFEAEIQIKRSRKSNLHTLTEAVVRAADRDHKPRDIAAEFCRLSIVHGAKAGVVLVAEGEDAQLSVVRSFGYSPDMIESFMSLKPDAPYPICIAYRSGSPVWLNSAVTAAAEPSVDPLSTTTASTGISAVP